VTRRVLHHNIRRSYIENPAGGGVETTEYNKKGVKLQGEEKWKADGDNISFDFDKSGNKINIKKIPAI
jgi:hypothetical protein